LCNSCASLAGLVLCFIAGFILLVIAPLHLQKRTEIRNVSRNLGDASDGRLLDISRIERRVAEYRPVQFVLVVTVERRLTDQHLIEQDAERPPVY